jgi:hypothetical protein
MSEVLDRRAYPQGQRTQTHTGANPLPPLVAASIAHFSLHSSTSLVWKTDRNSITFMLVSLTNRDVLWVGSCGFRHIPQTSRTTWINVFLVMKGPTFIQTAQVIYESMQHVLCDISDPTPRMKSWICWHMCSFHVSADFSISVPSAELYLKYKY